MDNQHTVNEASERAEQDLKNMVTTRKAIGSKPDIEDLADWWKKWYLSTPDGHDGAGHRKLGRILLKYATE